ncbi:MAG: HAMP domain-containing sensor histidine kinase [Eubacteriales bacterium]|nr:HAMP domain-containing sensor histidine kinase [Eubacteriales bacterium]
MEYLLSFLKDAFANGFHGYYLLLFSGVIALVFFQILALNPRNVSNRWCFAAGMLFGLGPLKEYLYYEVGLDLIAKGLLSSSAAELTYSLLSAAFYHLAMPTALVFALYFVEMEKAGRRRLTLLKILSYCPALGMALLFPWTQIRELQRSPFFMKATALYECLYGVVITVLILRTLWRGRMSSGFHQRALIGVCVLVPLWVWLALAFPYQAFGLKGLQKMWQLQLPVLLFILLYILFHSFREGIWGTRYSREIYDWGSDARVLQKNAYHTRHALENSLNKIDWCIMLLRNKGIEEPELEIIRSSTEHLHNFVRRTQMCSDHITLLPSPLVNVSTLFERIQRDFLPPKEKTVLLQIVCCDDQPLSCDATHVMECLQNLIANAVDAIPSSGVILLSYQYNARNGKAVITVADNGSGTAETDIRRLADPFYTTRKTRHNMGLGLYYCWNVMEAHRGRIEVNSIVGQGSAFSLLFPAQRAWRKEKRK